MYTMDIGVDLGYWSKVIILQTELYPDMISSRLSSRWQHLITVPFNILFQHRSLFSLVKQNLTLFPNWFVQAKSLYFKSMQMGTIYYSKNKFWLRTRIGIYTMYYLLIFIKPFESNFVLVLKTIFYMFDNNNKNLRKNLCCGCRWQGSPRRSNCCVSSWVSIFQLWFYKGELKIWQVRWIKGTG